MYRYTKRGKILITTTEITTFERHPVQSSISCLRSIYNYWWRWWRGGLESHRYSRTWALNDISPLFKSTAAFSKWWGWGIARILVWTRKPENCFQWGNICLWICIDKPSRKMFHTSGLPGRLFAWRMSEVHPAFGHKCKSQCGRKWKGGWPTKITL